MKKAMTKEEPKRTRTAQLTTGMAAHDVILAGLIDSEDDRSYGVI
jgi:hypothetical protein